MISFWVEKITEEYIKDLLETKMPMQMGKFLIPEVNNYIRFTLEHLKQLKPVVNRLDDKHQPEKVIFDSYIENNGFTLTKEQLDKAYKIYKQYKVEEKTEK